MIFELPGVAECACVGIPDGLGGEAVVLYIVRRDETLSADLVLAHCRGNLTAYKVSRTIVLSTQFQKSAVGKVLRRKLRSLAPTSAP